MKTTRLFFMGMLVILGGIAKGISQSATTSTNTYYGPSTMPGSGWANVLLGVNCGIVSSGNYNVAIGFESYKQITGGERNILIGALCGESSTTFGNKNTYVGERSGTGSSGSNNSFYGSLSGGAAAGSGNSVFGCVSSPGFLGSYNSVFGTGSHAGGGSLGGRNTVIGSNSSTSGNNNTFLGFNIRAISNYGNQLGNNNTFIGAGIIFPDNIENTIILASGGLTADGVVTTNNQKVYIAPNGYTGIGLGDNQIPQNRLEINATSTGAVSGTTGLRFRGLTSTILNPTETANNFLTVDTNGDVILRKSPNASSGSTAPCNFYSCDSTFDTTNPSYTATPRVRTVSMKENNLFFKTLDTINGPDSGKIFIGEKTNFSDVTGHYRLYVEGGILAEKVKIALRYDPSNPGQDGVNWKDYVFANDYKLMPLNEIESYVKENKHLPGIESACELLENGLDLGDMQAKQMGKIEELTLYAIAQEKQLEKQGKEIEELKAIVKTLLEKK